MFPRFFYSNSSAGRDISAITGMVSYPMAWWCRQCWAENPNDLSYQCSSCQEWITENNLPYDQKPHALHWRAMDRDPNSTKLYVHKENYVSKCQRQQESDKGRRKRESKKPFDFDW